MHTSRENVEMTLILIKNIVSKSSHYHGKSRHILVQMPQIEKRMPDSDSACRETC